MNLEFKNKTALVTASCKGIAGIYYDTMLENLLKGNAEKLNISYDEAIQQFLKENRPHVEVKRPGTVEEVASAVVYLASNKASFFNGVNLRVDGGSVASL